MRIRHLLLLGVGCLLVTRGNFAQNNNNQHPPETGRATAVGMINQLRGKVKMDPGQPGRPIVEVSLIGAGLTDRGFTRLVGLTYVKRLYLNRTLITDASIEAMEDMVDLETLWLGNCPNITGDEFGTLAELEHFRELDCSYTAVGDEAMGDLADSATLEKLWITGTNVTDIGFVGIPPGVDDIPNLRIVYVGRPSFISNQAIRIFRLIRPDVVVIRR